MFEAVISAGVLLDYIHSGVCPEGGPEIWLAIPSATTLS